MRKLILLLTCCLSLTMNAKVAYLLTGAVTDLASYKAAVPKETEDNKDQYPEVNAAEWFNEWFVKKGTGKFLTVEEFNAGAENLADVNALWIYIDRVGLNSDDVIADIDNDNKNKLGLNATFRANLADFVNNGGNLYVAKQATRLIGDLGLAKKNDEANIYPGFGNGGYSGAATWFVFAGFNNAHAYTEKVNTDHAFFANAIKRGENDHDKTSFELLYTSGRRITDNNCVIGNEELQGNLASFETRNNCRVLGTWDNGQSDCQCAGFIEFYPNGGRKGTVVMMGLAAYQWTSNNVGDVTKVWDANDANRGNGGKNVLRITENALNYLNGPSRSDVYIDDDFRADGREGADGDAHNRFMILHPNVRGLNAVAYDVIENAEITEKINDGANRLAFKSAGHVKLQIKLKETRSWQNWAQGIYTFTRDIDFAFNKNAQNVVNSDLSSNGRDGETGKFMLLHPNMQGMDSLGYAISFDGIEEAQQAEVVKIKDGGATRLAFTKAGQVKLNITLKYSDNYNTEFGKGELHATKEITFAFDKDKPDHGWSPTSLDDIKLNQEVVLYDRTQDLPVTYTFEPAENVIWEEENHKVKFIKAGDVNITASVTETRYLTSWPIGTHTYEKTVKVKSPLSWTKDPDVACVGEDNKYAHAETTGGTIVYTVEAGKEDYIAVASDGKITFKKDCADPIAITASVTIDGYTYSLTKTTRCNAPTVNWKTAPAASGKYDESLAFETELLYGPATIQYTTTNCEIKDGKIHLTVVGEATVQPYVEYPYGEGKLTYTGEIKKITVTAPVVSWAKDDKGDNMVPEDAAILEEEYKRTPKAVCNVPGLTVKYRSEAPTKISIDENTGALQYLAPTEGDGIDITAYVTVGGTEYSISHKTKCLKPIVEWITRPATTAKVGDVVEIKGRIRYGAATLGFDYVDTYIEYTAATETESAKIKFLKTGTTTIRPYAEAYNVKYYNDNTETSEQEGMGEEITITVSPDLKWTTAPMSAFVGEQGKKAVASTNEGTIVYSSSDEERVTVDQEGNLTFLGYETAAKVTITATVTIDEKDYSISGELNANLPNVMWTTAPAATAYETQTMDIAAELEYWEKHAVGFETTNCSYNSETKKLTIGEGTTATVRPYVELTADNKKYYGATKTIAVTLITFEWTHEPDEAYVGESKPNARATCNVQSATVKYESSDPTIASINETSGQITYLKEGTCNIYAFVVIDGQKYKSAPYVLKVVPYTRIVTNGNYGTICLPYASFDFDGMILYSIDRIEEDGLYLAKVDGQMEAGMPYIFKATDSKISVSLTGEKADAQAHNGLVGSFDKVEIEVSDASKTNYILSNNQLCKVVGDNVFVGANRAYISSAIELTPERLNIIIGNPIATGVESQMNGEKATKALKGGRVVILRAGRMYDLNGRLLK